MVPDLRRTLHIFKYAFFKNCSCSYLYIQHTIPKKPPPFLKKPFVHHSFKVPVPFAVQQSEGAEARHIAEVGWNRNQVVGDHGGKPTRAFTKIQPSHGAFPESQPFSHRSLSCLAEVKRKSI